MIGIKQIKQVIQDRDMSLEELVFDRLNMSYEDLLYELHYRLLELDYKFEDLERLEDY